MTAEQVTLRSAPHRMCDPEAAVRPSISMRSRADHDPEGLAASEPGAPRSGKAVCASRSNAANPLLHAQNPKQWEPGQRTREALRSPGCSQRGMACAPVTPARTGTRDRARRPPTMAGLAAASDRSRCERACRRSRSGAAAPTNIRAAARFVNVGHTACFSRSSESRSSRSNRVMSKRLRGSAQRNSRRGLRPRSATGTHLAPRGRRRPGRSERAAELRRRARGEGEATRSSPRPPRTRSPRASPRRSHERPRRPRGPSSRRRRRRRRARPKRRSEPPRSSFAGLRRSARRRRRGPPPRRRRPKTRGGRRRSRSARPRRRSAPPRS